MRIYTQENLINSLNLAKESTVTFLLGAGCSIASGCMSASKLVLEFKKRIYCSKNGIRYNDNMLINDISINRKISEEFDDTNIENPYSYYFEKCFPNSNDRSSFIKEKFVSIKPSYGYLCFANYLIGHKIKNVLTTNFDQLIEKAIRKLNPDYDISIKSDSLTPNLSASINIVKLHGDYNYDILRNTEFELNALSSKVDHYLKKINTQKIVVIGYSGQDKSVMKFLEEYLYLHPQTELYWCHLLNYFEEIEQVNKLIELNANSGYCLIDGLDELFVSLYNCYGSKNQIVDSFYSKYSNDNFLLLKNNQPEKMIYNCNPLKNNPSVLKVKKSIDSSKIRELNNENEDFFIVQYKDFLFCIGNKERLLNKLNLLNGSFEVVDLCSEQIPVSKKCKLIKEIIKLSKKQQGFNIYKDNIYVKSYDNIKKGLNISVDIFNGRICLFTNFNYFVTTASINEAQKHEINRLKSSLYAKNNYQSRNEQINLIFGNKFIFEYFSSTVIFSDKSFGNNIGSEAFDEYNCADEPIMVGENFKSVNQIKILTENGPRKTLFSVECIKVGVFSVEEDKAKLKEYLNNLINGTNKFGTDIIPQYRGFEKIFKKQITFLFNALPPFNMKQITKNCNSNLSKFKEFCLRGIKKMYDDHQIDIALIYIGDNLIQYRCEGELDLHDIIKLECANRYKTQFLEEKTIKSSDNINKKIFNLAMGIYTKTIGMAWFPDTYSKNTLFLGISFGKTANGINVGCSQMFDGAGRGMQLIISKVTDKNKKNQYLTKNEAFELGVKIRQTYYKTSKVDELKRIVIHRADPFKREEIAGFKMAFEGIDNFDLIQISDYSFFNCYKLVNSVCSGYPVKRGTTIKSSKDVAYVWTDGSINHSDIMNNKTYRNNKRGMGKPLKIKKSYGTASINEVVNDLMYLTKMDFNSADVIYSKMPVTLKYSRMVCELLKQGDLDDDLISFEYVM